MVKDIESVLKIKVVKELAVHCLGSTMNSNICTMVVQICEFVSPTRPFLLADVVVVASYSSTKHAINRKIIMELPSSRTSKIPTNFNQQLNIVKNMLLVF